MRDQVGPEGPGGVDIAEGLHEIRNAREHHALVSEAIRGNDGFPVDIEAHAAQAHEFEARGRHHGVRRDLLAGYETQSRRGEAFD